MTSYIDQNILPDEKILYRTRKHYIIFFQPCIWTIATIAIFIYPEHFVNIIALIFLIIAFFSWANAWLQYSVSEYAVTDKRILMCEGFFLKHTNETRLATISNVNITQGPLGQLLNYGTIVIKTFGGDDDPFVEIPNPAEFKKQLEIQLNKKP